MHDMAQWQPDPAINAHATAPTATTVRAGNVSLWEEEAATDETGETVFALVHAEQLLLWSARRWRHGRFQWPQVEAEFRRLLSDDWADALIAWEALLDQLHLFPVDWPDIGNGCCTSLSTDERALLTLIAVMQRGEKGRVSAAWLLAWLLPPARQGDIAGLARTLASALSRGRVRLPLRNPIPIGAAGTDQRSICK